MNKILKKITGYKPRDKDGFLTDSDDIVAWLAKSWLSERTSSPIVAKDVSIVDGVVHSHVGLRLWNAESYKKSNEWRERLEVRFGHINGDFSIKNVFINSTAGLPETVLGKFDVSIKDATLLSGLPKTVTGDVYIIAPDVTEIFDKDIPILGDSVQVNLLLPSTATYPDWDAAGFKCQYSDVNSKIASFDSLKLNDLRRSNEFENRVQKDGGGRKSPRP